MKRHIVTIVGLGMALGWISGGESVFAASIYKEGCQRSSSALFADFKARNVGDIITILIAESSSASETSKVDTQKSHNLDFALTHLFGAGKLLFGKDDGQELTRAKFSGENEFGGQAQTTNSGKLTAQLSATVKEVLPNGNLLIEGRRAIFYNKEKKNIIVSGIIRPQDVTPENTVLSTYVADASITFEGKGEVNNQSQPGILSKLFGWIPIF